MEEGIAIKEFDITMFCFYYKTFLFIGHILTTYSTG